MQRQPKVSTIALSLTAALGLFVGGPFGGPTPARAMSADSSGYAVVLPWVINSTNFNTVVSVENHSPGNVDLVLYYVGEATSDNPRRITCSERSATPAAQTFNLKVGPDAVLQFDLKALLEQKCNGAVTVTAKGDRGTLTIFAQGSDRFRISAAARVERVLNAGVVAFGYSQDGLPIGALEGSTQIIAGLRNGPGLRVDCLLGSFYDMSASGNLYRVSVKDSGGALIGDTILPLRPWSAAMLTDVFAAVRAPGAVVEGASVEVEPAANKTLPAMIASCRVFDSTNPQLLATAFRVGKVYEPLDLLRRRRVDVSETVAGVPFEFDPAEPRRQVHAVFLRAPDLVTCSVGSATGQLVLEVTTPDGQFWAGGSSSTGEFLTPPRGQVAGGNAGAWGIRVEADPNNPPSGPLPYQLSCVSGNGMSQIDYVNR